MQIRFAVLATILAAASYGCATETQQPAAGAAPAASGTPGAAPSSAKSYRTGSRLPTMDDDEGASSVSSVSKGDYIDGRNSAPTPLRGQ